MYRFILILCVIPLLSGCQYLRATKEYDEAKEQATAMSATAQEKSRQLTTAVVEVLEDEKKEDVTPHSKLALSFAKQDQLIEGFPIDPMPVERYIQLAISQEKEKLAELDREIAKVADEIAAFRQARLDQQKELDARTKELVEKGKLYEEQQKEEWWKRFWNWTKGTIGIGGIIAVIVLFPAVLPLLGQLLAGIIKLIPSLASALGVAATSTVDAVVKGVQQTRKQLKEDTKSTYTKEEVIAILDGNLDFHQKKGDKNLIKNRKTKLEI